MEINIDDYDVDGIKAELEDYYGTATYNGFSFAMVDLISLDDKSSEEIIIE